MLTLNNPISYLELSIHANKRLEELCIDTVKELVELDEDTLTDKIGRVNTYEVIESLMFTPFHLGMEFTEVQGITIYFREGGWGVIPVADGVELCESHRNVADAMRWLELHNVESERQFAIAQENWDNMCDDPPMPDDDDFDWEDEPAIQWTVTEVYNAKVPLIVGQVLTDTEHDTLKESFPKEFLAYPELNNHLDDLDWDDGHDCMGDSSHTFDETQSECHRCGHDPHVEEYLKEQQEAELYACFYKNWNGTTIKDYMEIAKGCKAAGDIGHPIVHRMPIEEIEQLMRRFIYHGYVPAESKGMKACLCQIQTMIPEDVDFCDYCC